MRSVSNKNSGFAIALAWPATLCKQAGAWYDLPMRWLGMNRKNYYRVGHAAIILISKKTGNCHYFDFGRYHAPFGFGRVRDAETDHDLAVQTKALISESGELRNYQEILLEIFRNPSCHGTGPLHASFASVDFTSAFNLAKEMQQQSPIQYGPFLLHGTNCSRFVNAVLLAGRPNAVAKFMLRFPKTLSPTPLGNVKCFDNIVTLSEHAPACTRETCDMQLTNPVTT